MKKLKRIFLTAAAVSIMTGLLPGCSTGGGGEEAGGKIDYSEYNFTGVSWVREAEHDIETIRFGTDGSFTYSCACGNPVNDADLCEGYTYDEETGTITLDCIEITDEMVTEITVLNCDGTLLELDFDGEVRTFEAEK